MAAGKSLSPADIRQTFAEYMWAGKQPFPLPFGGVLWPRPGGMVPAAPTVELREARSVPEPSMPYSLADTTTLADTGRPLSSASEGTSPVLPRPRQPGSPCGRPLPTRPPSAPWAAGRPRGSTRTPTRPRRTASVVAAAAAACPRATRWM
ncbi:SKI family transcriptional corepressor 2 [Caerostris extrusa]|uniref:SKI family transcriptional corepressor 2 n=1 Tax=Caerostris extrusa TaxID=172846 RepID=A0AAV4QWS8_CAEEX|nr:SKI family transcriptional corepressor 2 [Caerostris extrusa]